jgi:low affinity Fe/Cu permease
LFGFSDTWQLVINTGTTIVTFLMVFLIQATQNRDTLALQLKLDELIVANKNARNQIAGIEGAPEDEIERARVEILGRAG